MKLLKVLINGYSYNELRINKNLIFIMCTHFTDVSVPNIIIILDICTSNSCACEKNVNFLHSSCIISLNRIFRITHIKRKNSM